MKTSRVPPFFPLIVILGLALAACAKPTARAPLPTAKIDPVTSTGFHCPQPRPRMPVTSTELNLLVWTQYIPPEIQECFEKVYAITVNRYEYSSNEEMLERLAAGGRAYDLIQPTDYLIPSMVRNGLLEQLDHGHLDQIVEVAHRPDAEPRARGDLQEGVLQRVGPARCRHQPATRQLRW